jgi:hypothetical protein
MKKPKFKLAIAKKRPSTFLQFCRGAQLWISNSWHSSTTRETQKQKKTSSRKKKKKKKVENDLFVCCWSKQDTMLQLRFRCVGTRLVKQRETIFFFNPISSKKKSLLVIANAANCVESMFC